MPAPRPGRSVMQVNFQTEPSRYRHWRIEFDDDVAYLIMDVDQAGGLFDGYELKLNSYDLGVDIELNDAVQRLRFEHPEVRTVVVTSGQLKLKNGAAVAIDNKVRPADSANPAPQEH